MIPAWFNTCVTIILIILWGFMIAGAILISRDLARLKRLKKRYKDLVQYMEGEGS